MTALKRPLAPVKDVEDPEVMDMADSEAEDMAVTWPITSGSFSRLRMMAITSRRSRTTQRKRKRTRGKERKLCKWSTEEKRKLKDYLAMQGFEWTHVQCPAC
jgi:hypothetical protein